MRIAIILVQLYLEGHYISSIDILDAVGEGIAYGYSLWL